MMKSLEAVNLLGKEDVEQHSIAYFATEDGSNGKFPFF